MAGVVGVEEFTGEWYPGYRPEFFAAPFVTDAARPFRPGDEKAFWFLDFHWSRGLTPLAATLWAADGYCWGTQHAADELPLPPGRGIAVRMAGTHLYASPMAEPDPTRIAARFARFTERMPRFLDDFPRTWRRARDEIEATWNAFQPLDLARLRRRELAEVIVRARAYHKRAMEIHFEVMYPLLVNYLAFYGCCVEMGIDPDLIGRFFQGTETKILQLDRELSRLAGTARRAGLAGLFAEHPTDRLRSALGAHGGAASAWLTEFDDFLQVHGHRQDGTCDVGLPSWIEDDTNPLGMIKTFLLAGTDHDFAAAERNAVAERDAAIDAARSGLTREERVVFDQGLASNTAANFTWWQDDHNHYIDLRVMLPLRRACLELAERVGADRPDDLIHLFWPELMAVAEGGAYTGELRGLVRDRRQYFEHWYARRAGMPKVLGTIPASVQDPILLEIFGLDRAVLEAVRRPDAAAQTTLPGLPAARGRATGTARVLQSVDELHRLGPGEVLVCESTSPNWTPAFGTIAAAVCDGGGMLSHAAIVGREYGTPTVTAVGVATRAIADGDLVEVDGTRGVVTILERAAQRAAARAPERAAEPGEAAVSG